MVTRERLIEASIDLFSHHGFDGTSLSAIAKEAGVTQPTLNYHFRTKRLAGILLQSGGLFAHMVLGEEARVSMGTWMIRTGAILLAIALISLGVGLLRSRPEVT